jgi:histidinol phosphatase-like PHP family hydrolase
MTDSSKSSPSFQGRYWSHLHTVYSHGVATVRDYFDAARELQIDQLIFLEHTRLAPTYDTAAFIGEVRDEAAVAGVEAYVGFEAKILPGGRLDISDEVLETAQAVGIAEHSYPGDANALALDFARLVSEVTRSFPQQTFIWVHPGSWLVRHGKKVDGPAFTAMRDAASSAHVRIERNLKYDLVPAEIYRLLAADATVFGLDAHSIDDAHERWARQVFETQC